MKFESRVSISVKIIVEHILLPFHPAVLCQAWTALYLFAFYNMLNCTNLAFGTPMEKGYLAVKNMSYEILISSVTFFFFLH